MSERVDVLLDVLEAHAGGMEASALLAELRQRWPGLVERQADALLAEAGDAVVADGTWVRLARNDRAEARDEERAGTRVVAFDCETAVRLITARPYTDAHLFQIAGVRLGSDAAWVEAEPTFECFVTLPEGFEIFNSDTRARHAAAARDPAEVLTEFAGWVAGADYLCAYNGETADFEFIDRAASLAGVERVEHQRRCDGLYAALCLYPQLSRSHRLYELAEAVGIDLEIDAWHDALADSVVLARLLEHLAARLAAMPEDRRTLIAALCVDSATWSLLFELGGLGAPVAVVPGDGVVAAVLAGGMASVAPVRSRGRGTLGVVPARVKSGTYVDPHLLASAARGDADVRPAQGQMSQILRAWISGGTDGMCEAPTGIGKTYVTISTALEWLETHPGGRVVIATHTKQLQRQLAAELEKLARAEMPWLRGASGLVKGARNRLSLRALAHMVEDCAVEMAAAPGRGRRRTLWRNARFRELVVFLIVRLCAPFYNLSDEWEARSVDVMDLPAFFDDYCGGRLGAWLALLSQDETGDYHRPAAPPVVQGGPGSNGKVGDAGGEKDSAGDTNPSTGDPLAMHTELVAEAVERHRLVVTNHALLMAHLEDISDPQTLLMVDEAHAIEGAATEALSAHVTYEAFEVLAAETARLAREFSGVFDTSGLGRVADDMENTLRAELLPNAIARVFDRLVGPPGPDGTSRSTTLASSYSGEGARAQVLSALRELRALGNGAEHIANVLRAVSGTGALAQLTREETQRYWALLDRADAVAAPCAAIRDALTEIWPPPPQAPAAQAPAPAAQTPPPGAPLTNGGALDTGDTDTDGAVGDEEVDPDELDPVAEEDEDVEGEVANANDMPEDADGAPSDDVPGAIHPEQLALITPARSNSVVWADEKPGFDAADVRHTYRFSVHASPIDLEANPTWRALRSSFARSIWISATLSVAGNFDFIRSRLGFGADVAEEHLPTTFDYAKAARLFVFSDFPSWADHETLAVRTMSWQLSGFCAEVSRLGARPEGVDAVAPTPLRGGAMVITTSTRAAAAVADRLSGDLAGRGAQVPVHAAVLRGNARAVAEFEERGGVLAGTKGLWAGVDIASPERLRMLWVNKLPFAPFADPLVESRRAAFIARAENANVEDPEAAAQREYYLPIAALELRQGIGRLIRGPEHRGVIVISDRRLAGNDRLRRMYRNVFLGSLGGGLVRPEGDDPYGGNVVSMREGWRGIWSFLDELAELPDGRVGALCSDEALEAQAVPPDVRAILDLSLSEAEVASFAAPGADALRDEVARRCAEVARLLRGEDAFKLKDEQRLVIDRVVDGGDCLALLPTGFGKSFCFQLPALVLPGVTVVISPLVALMADQAMALNRSIGGAVRALVSPLRDSSSRTGKAEVTAALAGTAAVGAGAEIKLVYISPERAAQRAFREALYAGAESGCLARVAIDEAHTLVQWGDDFRPAFRRLSPVLAELRTRSAAVGHQLSISALTATANETVREGLLDSVFGASADCAGDGVDGPLVVEANPIRPEIAVYTREFAKRGGAVAISGIAESVAGASPGHLIVYCLTVNETQAVYAELCQWAGQAEADWVVRRFHGRLSEAEKASTLNAFKEAPYPGEEGYRKMIVVATSAFGLGIDRSDIAAVLCLSPPPDLAALYQQLGRAGRGLAQGGNGAQGAVGMALAHRQGWRMVEFLTTHDLPISVLDDLGRRVLVCGGLLDPREVAEDAIAAAVAAGQMSVDAARTTRVRDEYRAGVVRTMATLASLGALVDHGDIPARVKVTSGSFEPEDEADLDFVAAVLDLAADPTLRVRATLDLPTLHEMLVGTGLTEPGDGPAETWIRLLDAHGAGWLDVSQYASDQRYLSAIEIRTDVLPVGFEPRVGGRAVRAVREIATMKTWFNSQTECANRGLADYFSQGLPAGTCGDAACRCSRCWLDAEAMADPAAQPALFAAFMRHNPAPIAAADDARRTAALRRDIVSILRLRRNFYRGVTTWQFEALFNGSDRTWSGRRGRSFSVPRWIPNHARFGSGRGWLRRNRLFEVLDDLEDAGVIVKEGPYWRYAPFAARAAQQAAAQAVPAP